MLALVDKGSYIKIWTETPFTKGDLELLHESHPEVTYTPVSLNIWDIIGYLTHLDKKVNQLCLNPL